MRSTVHFITQIINNMIDTSLFPHDLKLAEVNLFIKKAAPQIWETLDLSVCSQPCQKFLSEFCMTN